MTESVEFLSEEEIAAIESLHPMEGTQMAMARDLFVFQIYTGLAMPIPGVRHFRLQECRRQMGDTGNRIKTGVPYVSQLMPQAVECWSITACRHRK